MTSDVEAVPSATCRAPHVALRFSPTGEVHACCVNDTYPLGRIGEASITDIWRGPALNELRVALDDADYGLGCQDCEVDHLLGERLQTHAEQFDRYPQPATPLPWPRRVEFALSNTCTLQCIQCNGDLSSAIRAQREHRPPLRSPYGDAFFEELRELLPHVEVAVFIGGEPFLSRECRRVWDLMIELGVRPEVHVTTNATQWDARVERYLHALRMTVAVSLDGATAGVNDAIRLGSEFATVTSIRDRFLAATRSYGGAFCLNHCLLRANWHEMVAFLLEADRLDVDVHVIPVHYPRWASIFSLPSDEFTAIARAVATDPAARRLGRNRAVWAGIVDHLEAYAAGREEGTAVVIGTALSEEAIESLRADLAAWAGQEPLAIRAPQGTIEAVEVADWASGLGMDALVGRPVEVIDEELVPRLGPRRDLATERSGAGYHVLRYRHEQPEGEAEFRTVVIPEWGVLTVTKAPAIVAWR